VRRRRRYFLPFFCRSPFLIRTVVSPVVITISSSIATRAKGTRKIGEIVTPEDFNCGTSRPRSGVACDCAAENVRYIEVRFSPILHTRHGLSLKESVEAVRDGETGLLVDGNSVEEIAAAINRLLADDELRKRLEQGALAHAQANSWTTRAAEFQSLCQQLAAK